MTSGRDTRRRSASGIAPASKNGPLWTDNGREGIFNLISKIIKKVSILMMAVAVVALFLAVLVNAYEIVGRPLFDSSLLLLQDFTLLCMVWFSVPGLVAISCEGIDVVVDYFFEKFPPKARDYIEILNDIVVALAYVVLFVFSVNLAILRQGKTMSASEIPLIYYTLAMNASFFMMAVIYLEKFVKRIRARVKGGGNS